MAVRRQQQPTGADVLFDAARVWSSRAVSLTEEVAKITLRYRSGREITVDAPTFLPAVHQPDPKPRPQARRGPGYRSIHWFGTTYHFSESQAKAVKLLWQAWKADVPDVPDKLLLKVSGSDAGRVADLFRGADAWGALIIEGATRGVHRLAPPPA